MGKYDKSCRIHVQSWPKVPTTLKKAHFLNARVARVFGAIYMYSGVYECT